MSIKTRFESNMEDHGEVLAAVRKNMLPDLEKLCAVCIESLRAGGKILFFGNGGSAADAQHLAAEIAVRYVLERPALAAMALSTDTSVLTATGNDMGFENVFARQIEALGRPGDVAIAISTSGTSTNIINAIEAARKGGLVAAGLSGRDGGTMKGVCDPLIVVPSDRTARIQEMHILIGHMLCGALEI